MNNEANKELINPFVFSTPKYPDDRGYFFESFNEEDFARIYLEKTGHTMEDDGLVFVQDNVSYSIENVIRGLHFQYKNPQSKLIRVIKGEIFDIIIDIRPDSKDFGKTWGVKISDDLNNAFYVPQGFAHGFVAVRPSIVSYKVGYNLRVADDEYGIAYNDEEVKFPKTDHPILSERDANQMSMQEYRKMVIKDYTERNKIIMNIAIRTESMELEVQRNNDIIEKMKKGLKDE